jgi:hypothetical protein
MAAAAPVQTELVTFNVFMAAAFLSTALVVETALCRDDDQVVKATKQDAALHVRAGNFTSAPSYP